MSDKVEVVRRSEHTGRAGMIGRWERWGPINGLLLCLAWAPMAIVIRRGLISVSLNGVEIFWRDKPVTDAGRHSQAVSVGFIFLLGFLGALVERSAFRAC